MRLGWLPTGSGAGRFTRRTGNGGAAGGAAFKRGLARNFRRGSSGPASSSDGKSGASSSSSLTSTGVVC